jgi:hypothetical protein
MSNFQFQTFIDNTVIDATNMSDSALVASFAAHGCGDFIHFPNFDRDSLIDLYIADVCYDGFYSLYAKLLNTL